MTEERPSGRPWSRNDEIARWCYACGDLNPIGLHLEFRVEDDWAVADFVAQREHQGYPGYVHGGIVSSLLDEAMGWATYGRGIWALTGKLETRIRGIVPTNELLRVRARIARDRGKTLDLVAELRDADGKLLAEANGLLFRATGEQARLIEEAAKAMMTDR
ncbi:MAG TPA: PaaI family thioesterase [Dehalococcoidia bacterium]|nr:PaaI family thioesterase [Dehalococcoidia bacterium]